MSNRFAAGKHAIAECDRCGFRFKLSQLKKLTLKDHVTNIMVCPECWEADHPQLQLGKYPVDDPMALREPRPDLSLGQGGSRDIFWGWNPVGGARSYDDNLTPNTLICQGTIGTVTVEIS